MSRTYVAPISPDLKFELSEGAPATRRPTGVCVDATFATVDLHYTGAHTRQHFNLPADPRLLHAIADALKGIADGIHAGR
jgi:hypothetical protein